MTPDQAFDQYNGQGINVDGAYGNQCVDWALQFASAIGHPLSGGGNAIDYAGRSIAGYTWVPNSPSAVPGKGDIVVWGRAVGQYGHIAVANGDGDTNGFKSYDQNWPLQVDANGNGTGVVHLQKHNYNGVLGWQHPDSLGDTVADAQLQADYDGAIAELAAERKGYAELKANYDGATAELDAERKSYEGQISDLHKNVTDLQKTASDLAEQAKVAKGDGVPLVSHSFSELLSALITKLTGGK